MQAGRYNTKRSSPIALIGICLCYHVVRKVTGEWLCQSLACQQSLESTDKRQEPSKSYRLASFGSCLANIAAVFPYIAEFRWHFTKSPTMSVSFESQAALRDCHKLELYVVVSPHTTVRTAKQPINSAAANRPRNCFLPKIACKMEARSTHAPMLGEYSTRSATTNLVLSQSKSNKIHTQRKRVS